MEARLEWARSIQRQDQALAAEEHLDPVVHPLGIGAVAPVGEQALLLSQAKPRLLGVDLDGGP